MTEAEVRHMHQDLEMIRQDISLIKHILMAVSPNENYPIILSTNVMCSRKEFHISDQTKTILNDCFQIFKI